MTDSTPNSGPGSLSPTPTRTSAYVRIAKPSEISALAAVYARAFARDPQMNWFGSVRVRAPVVALAEDIGNINRIDDLNCDASARRTLAGLQHFQLVVAKMAQIQGLVVVVVEKEVSKEDEGEDHCEEQEKEKERVSEAEEILKERIVGGALWLKPGASMDPSPITFVRISPWRSIWSWGLRGLKRTLIDYTPKAEKIADRVFAARGLKRLDSWHLLEIAVDPACQGKGYGSLLMHDGLQRASGKPVHLEATTTRSRDIYVHFGFELNEERQFGVGSVDGMGIAAKGKAAVGWPCFFMTKWKNP